jgi:hypothetical protein
MLGGVRGGPESPHRRSTAYSIAFSNNEAGGRTMILSTLFSMVALSQVVVADASLSLPRHLEYSFTVSEQGQQESQFGASGSAEQAYSMPESSALSTSSGMGGAAMSQGGTGTMMVDVLSVTPDQALQVQISETVVGEPRARSSYICTVYGNTTVSCPDNASPSQAEWVLLSFLGRRFVDGAPWDSNGRWSRTQDTPQYKMTQQFTKTATADSAIVNIVENKKMTLHNGGYSSQTQDSRVAYNVALEVPVSVKGEITTQSASDSAHMTVDLKLKSDSWAPDATPSAHP